MHVIPSSSTGTLRGTGMLGSGGGSPTPGSMVRGVASLSLYARGQGVTRLGQETAFSQRDPRSRLQVTGTRDQNSFVFLVLSVPSHLFSITVLARRQHHHLDYILIRCIFLCCVLPRLIHSVLAIR